MPPSERAKYLIAIAEEIEKDSSKFSAIETLDNGKPKVCIQSRFHGLLDHGNLIFSAFSARSIPCLCHIKLRSSLKLQAEAEGDVGDAASTFRYYAKLITDMAPVETLDHSQAETFKAEIVKEAIGVVGAIVPWNYPLLMATWKLAPALAAGCTIVLKPSELTPVSAIEFGKICQTVKLPKGVVNIIPGLGYEAGEALAMNKGLDKISFTGSVPTGRKIMMAASHGPIPVTLELGGKSPLVLLEDAMSGDKARKDVIEWIKFGIFFNSVGFSLDHRTMLRSFIWANFLVGKTNRAKSAPPPPVSSPLNPSPPKSSPNSSKKPTPSKSAADSPKVPRWAPSSAKDSMKKCRITFERRLLRVLPSLVVDRTSQRVSRRVTF